MCEYPSVWGRLNYGKTIVVFYLNTDFANCIYIANLTYRENTSTHQHINIIITTTSMVHHTTHQHINTSTHHGAHHISHIFLTKIIPFCIYVINSITILSCGCLMIWWCDDVLMCWCVDVLMCWCVDVFSLFRTSVYALFIRVYGILIIYLLPVLITYCRMFLFRNELWIEC